MKNLLFIFAFFVGISAFGQEKPAEELKITKIKDLGKICILWPAELKSPPLVFNADDYYRSQVVQPKSLQRLFPCADISKVACKVCAEKYGNPTQPLNQDSPFLHTLNGAVYTFDFLRYSVR